MDVLAEFLPFILFLLYALLRVLRGRKTAPEDGAPLPGIDDREQAPQPRTDFDELARHLEALVTGTLPEAKAPPPVVKPRFEPEFHNAKAPVNEAASFQHQRHGFGPENPLSEETFERAPAFAPLRRSAPKPSSFDPHGLKRQPEVRKAPGSNWRARLADPKRAREAFVLKTILDRSRDRRR